MLTDTHRFIAIPIGRKFKVKEVPQKAPEPNDKLEAIFKTARMRPKERHVLEGVKQTGLPQSFVHRWFEKRRRVGQPTQMMKFCEETWSLVFFFVATVYGFAALWDKSWLTDPLQCWVRLLFDRCRILMIS
jgi:ceramide synthetase